MEFIYSAIAVFGLTAMLGMYLLTMLLRAKTIPTAAAFMHGLLAFTSLILLSVYTFGHPPGPWPSLIIFSLAATGGLFMIYRNITEQPIPKWLAIAHGLTAITGFALLLIFAF